MQILDKVKGSLRMTHAKFDEAVILPLIDSCKMDLLSAGVTRKIIYSGNNELLDRAIIHYCGANFPGEGSDVRMMEFHSRSYNSLKIQLALGGDDLFLKK